MVRRTETETAPETGLEKNQGHDSQPWAAAALSGGVDSAVAARLMTQDGWRVLGLFLRLHDEAGPAEESARAVARSLDIPFTVIDAQARFLDRVVRPFSRAYRRGLTPNPCVTCNETVKFAILHETAHEAGCSVVITGHYARIARDPDADCHLLLRAQDQARDQSYCLYRLPQSVLARTRFPLGRYTKAQTRQLARELGLPAADRPDSQDICFLGDRGYRDVVETGCRPVPGDIIDVDGRVVGRHSGIHLFTLGQRRGLGINSPRPLYVIRIDPRTNTVTVGERKNAYFSRVSVSDAVFVHPDPPPPTFQATARHRYRSPEAQVTVRVTGRGDDGTYLLDAVFHDPQFAPAPGQSFVLYDGDLVLGGGVITSAH